MVSAWLFQLILFAIHDHRRDMLIHKNEYGGEQRGYDGGGHKPWLIFIALERVYDPAAWRYRVLELDRHNELGRVEAERIVGAHSYQNGDHNSEVGHLGAHKGREEATGAKVAQSHGQQERECVQKDRHEENVRRVFAFGDVLVLGAQARTLGSVERDERGVDWRLKGAVRSLLQATKTVLIGVEFSVVVERVAGERSALANGKQLLDRLHYENERD